MPVTVKLENSILMVCLDGVYEFPEVTLAITPAISDPRFFPGCFILIDERTATVNVSAEEKRARVAWIASLRPKIGERLALVTTDSPSRYGVARMASVFFEIEGFEAAVFTDLETAWRWLLDALAEVGRTI